MSQDFTLTEAQKITAKLEAMVRVFLDTEIAGETQKGLLTRVAELKEQFDPTKISFASLAQKREYQKVLEQIEELLNHQRASIEEMTESVRQSYIEELKKIGENALEAWIKPSTLELQEKQESFSKMIDAQFKLAKESIQDNSINPLLVFSLAFAGAVLGGVMVGLLLA